MLTRYLQHLRDKGNKSETIEWHQHKLQVFRTWLCSRSLSEQAQPVSRALVLEYLNHRRSERKAESTVSGDLRALAAMFRWAHKTGYIAVNPCDGIKLQPPAPCTQDPFSPGEVAQLLVYLRDLNDQMSRRDAFVILWLYDTKCRVSAMCRMRLGDLDIERRRVWVTDKYRKRRRLAWGSRTHEALLQWLEVRPDIDLLLCNRRGQPWTRFGVYQMFRRVCDRADVEFRKVHMLRFSYACEFLREGGADRAWQLQLIMGHADLTQIQQVYGRRVNEDLALETMQELSPGDRLEI